MNFILSFLTIVNLFGLIYLIFLFYRKSGTGSYQAKNIPLDINRPFKMNLVRFNPFDEVGGDQSFILCLLDNHNTGVIITSLHSRSFTRVYAKTIKNGECDNSALSKEESRCLIKTING